jgi:hypothetical protein
MDSLSQPTPGPLIRLCDIPNLPWLPPRRGQSKLSYPTLWRWAKDGAAGVILKTFSVGGSRCTTEAWLREFFADVAAARAGQPQQPTIRQPAARQREIAADRKRLDEAGIC